MLPADHRVKGEHAQKEQRLFRGFVHAQGELARIDELLVPLENGRRQAEKRKTRLLLADGEPGGVGFGKEAEIIGEDLGRAGEIRLVLYSFSLKVGFS
jgi:hypothetical protein